MTNRFWKAFRNFLLLGVVFLIGFFINSLYGNPVSALIARNTAQEVLWEQFPNIPYSISACSYNIVSGCYEARVSREGSMDDWFYIQVRPDGTFRSHSYADQVPNLWNTRDRVSRDYYELGKTLMKLPDFPGESLHVSTHLRFCNRECPEEYSLFLEDLEVDGVYDLAELGAAAGELHVRAVSENLTSETAAAIMLKVHELTQEAGLRYAVMDFTLERQRNAWNPEDYISAPLFPASEITAEGLADRIRAADAAHKAWVEAEEAAAEQAEEAE